MFDRSVSYVPMASNRLFLGAILLANAGSAFARLGAAITAERGFELGDSLAGYGYSIDSQRIVNQQCFNATASEPQGSHGFVQLDSSISFREMESKFSYSVEAGVNFGFFSSKADASYLKEIKEKDFSLSFNYYSGASGTVRVQLGAGENVLNDSGRQQYDNNASKPYFGVVCGDEYIDSYELGALLAMSLKIDFASHYEKEEFEGHISGSLGDIISASASIQKAVSETKVTGKLTMVAYQQGGDPGQLAKILSKDAGGDYYATTCDLDNLDACKATASGLLDYARDYFPDQYSVVTGENVTTLGFGFYTSKPLRYVGLTPVPSLLDDQARKDRDALVASYQQQNCYAQKFESLVHGYPVSWQTSTQFYQQITDAYQVVKDNLALILGGGSISSKGLEACYLTPDVCEDVVEDIQPNIQPVDFSFLEALQYYIKGSLTAFFYNGGLNWGYKNLASVQSVDIMEFSDWQNIQYGLTDSTDCTMVGKGYFNHGVLQTDNMTIKGGWLCRGGVSDFPNYRCKSPFFFDEMARCNAQARVERVHDDVCAF